MAPIYVPTPNKLTVISCSPSISYIRPLVTREQLLGLQEQLIPVDVPFTAGMRLVMDVGVDRIRGCIYHSNLGPAWHQMTFRDIALPLRGGNLVFVK